ncbi:MAG: hypothetical protein WBQ15_06505 [Candidatus Sulfotelmatobacter sp.]
MNSGEPSDHEKHSSLARAEANKNAADDEARRIRRLQLMISMVSSVISQDSSLTVEEASELAAGAKRAALAMFPDKDRLRPSLQTPPAAPPARTLPPALISGLPNIHAYIFESETELEMPAIT